MVGVLVRGGQLEALPVDAHVERGGGGRAERRRARDERVPRVVGDVGGGGALAVGEQLEVELADLVAVGVGDRQFEREGLVIWNDVTGDRWGVGGVLVRRYDRARRHRLGWYPPMWRALILGGQDPLPSRSGELER